MEIVQVEFGCPVVNVIILLHGYLNKNILHSDLQMCIEKIGKSVRNQLIHTVLNTNCFSRKHSSWQIMFIFYTLLFFIVLLVESIR